MLPFGGYKTDLMPSNLKVESFDFLCLKAFYQVTHSNSGTTDVTSPLLCLSKRKEKEILKKKSRAENLNVSRQCFERLPSTDSKLQHQGRNECIF